MYGLPGTLSGLSSQIVSLKIFVTLFPRKNCPEKISYVFSKEKAFLIFQETEVSSPKIKKAPIFLSHFLFVERELFKHKRKRKSLLFFPYKETKFSKSKYFFIIVIKHFVSFYIFSILKQLIFFHDHIVALFLFLFFFSGFFYFLDSIWLISF